MPNQINTWTTESTSFKKKSKFTHTSNMQDSIYRSSSTWFTMLNYKHKTEQIGTQLRLRHGCIPESKDLAKSQGSYLVNSVADWVNVPIQLTELMRSVRVDSLSRNRSANFPSILRRFMKDDTSRWSIQPPIPAWTYRLNRLKDT